ncbi:MAG TPA: phosphoribosyltransferase family protein [Thermomicrobiales bacterium]|nr:phosphoribosyltransferase family protein [Thermomicrobiales bacterium]
MSGFWVGETDAAVAEKRGAVPDTDGAGVRPTSPAQPALPAFRRLLLAGDTRFAHPAERDFARLLSFYGIRWSYEPTTFAIDWTPSGQPCGSFTPDFYLPDQGMYVELTTMRQPLVTRKNRKLRRLRALYPNVRVKLLYKRDLQRLHLAHPAAEEPMTLERVGEVLFGEGEIRDRLAGLAERIADEWLALGRGGDTPVVLGVGPGSARTVTAIVQSFGQMGLVVEAERLGIARYRGQEATTRIRLGQRPGGGVLGRRVLVVEDVVSSGLSLRAVGAWLARQGVAEWRACALLDRHSARLIDVPVEWAAFPAPDDLLVGFGLSLRCHFSGLPHIARLERIPM